MYTIERQGYTELIPLILNVVDDMLLNGFTAVYPVDGAGVYTAPTTTNFKIILQSTATSNALHSSQPWRVAFEMWDTIQSPSATIDQSVSQPLILTAYVGTSIQLKDDGTIAKLKKPRVLAGHYDLEPVGNVGAKWTGGGAPGVLGWDDTPNQISPLEGLFNRWILGNLDTGAAYPMTYRLTITDRGVFLGIWQTSSQETGARFHWMLIQRSVSKDSGKITGTTTETANSRCPVFVISSTQNDATPVISKYFKFIAREVDVLAPSARRDVTQDSEDNPAILNPKKQVSFNEDGNYVITLLNNLTTPRFKYTDELDMVGTISADVVGNSHELQFTVYGEALPRTYRALQPNDLDNTGMRLMVLVANPNE